MEQINSNYFFGKEMKEQPLISIIIPVYNAAKYIKKCLLQIINQRYKNLQIICIDDGSTDKSLSIIKQIAESDKRITCIASQNRGPAHARNVGLNIAKGEYVSFVDADDFVENDIYSTLVEEAKNKNADVVVFGGWPYPNTGVPEWIDVKLASTNAVYEGKNEVIRALFQEESSRPFLWLHFIKRKLFEYPTPIRFNESMDLGEDQVLQFEYFPRAEKVVFINKRLYTYRWSQEGSLMWKYNNMRLTKFEKHIKLVEAVFKNWRALGYKDVEGYLSDWAVNFLYNDLKRLPKCFQYKFSKQIVEIASTYNYMLYMCSDYLYDKASEIVEMSQVQKDYESVLTLDIKNLKDQLNRVERQINLTLKSKKFRIGRLFTGCKNRLNIDSVLPPQRKKN